MDPIGRLRPVEDPIRAPEVFLYRWRTPRALSAIGPYRAINACRTDVRISDTYAQEKVGRLEIPVVRHVEAESKQDGKENKAQTATTTNRGTRWEERAPGIRQSQHRSSH